MTNQNLAASAGLAIALALVLLTALASQLYAQVSDNTHQIFRGREGNYDIVVGVLPERPAVGTVHFSIRPLDAATSLPVTEAMVRIVANNPDGEPTFQARALNTPDDPQRYIANITFNTPGAWTLAIEVENADLGEATAVMPFEVAEQTVTPALAGGIAFIVLFGVLVAGGVYVWYSARRARRALG